MTTQQSEVYCTQCGALGSAGDLFCRQCGARRGSVVRLAGEQGEPGAGRSTGEKLTSPPPPPSSWLREPSAPRTGLSGPVASSVASRSQPVRSISYPAAVAAPPAQLPARLTCSFCSMPIPAGADRCNNCGGSRALVASGMCFRCGAANPSSNRYCGGCGRLLVANALSSQRPTTSALPVIGSIILPGLGQMMNGEAVKGFMLLGAALLMISTEPTILTPIYLLITAISAIDAALSQSRRERAAYRAQDWA